MSASLMHPSNSFSDESQRLADAVLIAVRAHGSDLRDDGTTLFIIHPIRVSELLRQIASEFDVDVLIAALLHDSIEKTDITYENLCELVGTRAANIVQELTFDPSLPQREQYKAALEHAIQLSPSAKKIKLADRLDNTYDLLKGCGSKDKCKRYLEEADKVLQSCEGICPPLEQELRNALGKLRFNCG